MLDQFISDSEFCVPLQNLLWEEFIGDEWTTDIYINVAPIYADHQLFYSGTLSNRILQNPWFVEYCTSLTAKFGGWSELEHVLFEKGKAELPLYRLRRNFRDQMEFELRCDLPENIYAWIGKYDKGTKFYLHDGLTYGVVSKWGISVSTTKKEPFMELPYGVLKPLGVKEGVSDEGGKGLEDYFEQRRRDNFNSDFTK